MPLQSLHIINPLQNQNIFMVNNINNNITTLPTMIIINKVHINHKIKIIIDQV